MGYSEIRSNVVKVNYLKGKPACEAVLPAKPKLPKPKETVRSNIYRLWITDVRDVKESESSDKMFKKRVHPTVCFNHSAGCDLRSARDIDVSEHIELSNSND